MLFKQRVFSRLDSYDIYDEYGNTLYTVKGQLSWEHCLKIFDAEGRELGSCYIEFTYTGDNIVKAWRSGDESELTDAERQTCAKAEAIVADVMSAASTETELERALHDWICANVSYVSADTSIAADTLNRPLTAVGALLDGEANCQGYADAFYLLAALSGFEVGRMHVEESGGGI